MTLSDAVVKLILSLSPQRIFLWAILGKGVSVDWRNGQILCPKCLANEIFSHMAYDAHVEIKDQPMRAGCASDRFLCRVCFESINFEGRVGRRLNNGNPFSIFTLRNFRRCVWLNGRRHMRKIKAVTSKKLRR